jgi:hypothetical protein
MAGRVWPAAVLLLPAALGCLPQESSNLLVPANPFSNAPVVPTPTQSAYAPAPVETATRVAQVGHKLVTANPQLGLRPVFRTIGSPTPLIFHRDTVEVAVSEGLVRQCATEERLAAVLAAELGKMASEHQAATALQARQFDREPPALMDIGNDHVGSRGDADLARAAELAPYDQARRRAAHGPPPAPPDPQALARTILTKAGHPASELDAAAPLLKTAAEDRTLEKQLTSQGPARPWAP